MSMMSICYSSELKLHVHWVCSSAFYQHNPQNYPLLNSVWNSNDPCFEWTSYLHVLAPNLKTMKFHLFLPNVFRLYIYIHMYHYVLYALYFKDCTHMIQVICVYNIFLCRGYIDFRQLQCFLLQSFAIPRCLVARSGVLCKHLGQLPKEIEIELGCLRLLHVTKNLFLQDDKPSISPHILRSEWCLDHTFNSVRDWVRWLLRIYCIFHRLLSGIIWSWYGHASTQGSISNQEMIPLVV